MHRPRPWKPRTERARSLRAAQTPPEAVLWSRLRDRRLGGFRFRRQQPIGPYIADFYCASARLIIEIDGASHGERRLHDSARDARMRSEGLLTLRFTVRDLTLHEAAVLEKILSVARERMSLRFGENSTPR